MWNVLPNVNFLRFAVLELEAVTETRMDGRTDRRLMFLLDMGRRIINNVHFRFYAAHRFNSWFGAVEWTKLVSSLSAHTKTGNFVVMIIITFCDSVVTLRKFLLATFYVGESVDYIVPIHSSSLSMAMHGK